MKITGEKIDFHISTDEVVVLCLFFIKCCAEFVMIFLECCKDCLVILK